MAMPMFALRSGAPRLKTCLLCPLLFFSVFTVQAAASRRVYQRCGKTWVTSDCNAKAYTLSWCRCK